MKILNIKIDKINNLKCYYGNSKKKEFDKSNILINYIKDQDKHNNCFFKFVANNGNMKGDPLPNVLKKCIINYEENNFEIQENQYFYIYIVKTFDIIYKNKMVKLTKELNKNYDKITIFGKGPTFINVPKKDKELRCAINQASNLVDNVDFICMNDQHNVFKINDNVYKNLKYLLVPEYMHIKQKFNIDGHFSKIFNYLDGKFFGKVIVYNLKTSHCNNNIFINLKTALTSANNCFEFLAEYSNIKNAHTYGIGMNCEVNYHNIFNGNGIYDANRINLIKKSFNSIARNKIKLVIN